MKVLLIHNCYGRFSGEEAVVAAQEKLLTDNGHEVTSFERSSAEIPAMKLGKLRALSSGLHSSSSCKAVRAMLRRRRPDVVNVHNVYPLISPSVLKVCRDEGVPVVMTVHNYRLICPNGLFMTQDEICHRCAGGREYWCLLRNCEGSLAKSFGYALRNWVARKRRAFLDNVTMFMALTEFQRQQLISEGYPAERIAVVPNMTSIEKNSVDGELGEYVAFVGRVSPEKGIATLRQAAESLPDVPMRAAGSYEGNEHLADGGPASLEFLGQLEHNSLDPFYANSRIVVLPSVCYEGFPMILPEAMLHGKPVIASRIGGIPEIVDDGVTGLLFEPGNAEDLAEKIRYLWDRPELCRRMGQAGREKVLREYTPQRYYERLMAVYEKAIEIDSCTV
jgi:glycosyltransferase involved in cell wall biosynthesis